MRGWVVALAFLGALSCAGKAPRAYGEVVVSVDGDWPSAAELDRLRVDLYAQDGHWFETRDIPDFGTTRPVSFSVFSADEGRESFVWLRLRAYPAGRLRDVPSSGVPRLVVEGVDVTPAAEPATALAVDRLLLVRLQPGFQQGLAVTLSGACAGSPSVLRSGDATRGPISPQARTCLASAPEVDEVVESVTRPKGEAPAVDHSWGVEPCPAAFPVNDARVCIPGGPMLLGTTDLVLVRGEDPTPERLVLVSRFVMDRDEVTVGRWRAALAAGMPPPDLPPSANPGPLLPDSTNESVAGCTASDAPAGREEHPLNCVGRAASRAFCKFYGGDLPSEVQWEYAASVAGRARKVSYAWGDEAPDCARAAWGRGDAANGGNTTCRALGAGVPPVTEPADVTALGVRALGGSLTEWTRDPAKPYSASCWAEAPRRDPACSDERAEAFIARGGAWDGDASYLRATNRFRAAVDRRSPILGFRCVYPLPPESAP